VGKPQGFLQVPLGLEGTGGGAGFFDLLGQFVYLALETRHSLVFNGPGKVLVYLINLTGQILALGGQIQA
jgi:hypothetical protein